MAALAATAAGLLLPACIFHPNRNTDLGVKVAPGSAPDKLLFSKAQVEIDHGRYDVGRLTLQTLINTYPDSEYLSQAKLLTANSYYKEGGISGLTQAEAEYNDFITLFPTAPEAPEAKYRAGMCHFRLMGKPDRDLSEARGAEDEFKAFLDKYPDNSLVPLVKGRLREVQEVLAEGDYQTALLYYKRGVNRAAASRFKEIADSYPDFSQADQALWYLGSSEERLRKPDEAAAAYARLLTDYPLSTSVKPAQTRLVAMHKPVPKATKATLARARADRITAQRVHFSLIAKAKGELTGAPDLSATRHGPVHLGQRPTGGVETAQAQSSPRNADIAVQPVPDSAAPAAASGTNAPASSPPASSNPPSASNPPSNEPAPSASAPSSSSSSTAPSAGNSDSAAAAASSSSKSGPSAKVSTKSSDDTDPAGSSSSSSKKKKGKLHFLKKIVP